MFGTGTGTGTGGFGFGINLHPPPPPPPPSCPRDNLSSIVGGSPIIPYHHHHHPTIIMSFPSSRKLPPRTKRTTTTTTTTSWRIRASSFTTTEPADTLPRVVVPLNLYQILRIQQNASSLEIKTAYRKLAKQFHPDALPPTSSESSSFSSSSSSDGGDGARDFMAIHNAYATLSDPTERARYDLSIQIQIQTTTSSSHTRRFHTYYSSSSSSSSSAVDGNEKNRSYGGMQTRRWETDQCW